MNIINKETQKPDPEPETIATTLPVEIQTPSLTNIYKDKENIL